MDTIHMGLDRIPVVIDPELPNLGETDHSQGGTVITLRKLETWEDYQTLFHEVLHAVEWAYGLKLGEHRVRTLEKVIPMVLIQNPEMTKGMVDGYHAQHSQEQSDGTGGTASESPEGACGPGGVGGATGAGTDGVPERDRGGRGHH